MRQWSGLPELRANQGREWNTASSRCPSGSRIAADAGISGSGGSTVASFFVGDVTLLPGSDRTLTSGGAVDLPRAEIRQARALLVRFHFAGRVRDARVPPAKGGAGGGMPDYGGDDMDY